jgi:methionyl-tRNA formyltransferase
LKVVYFGSSEFSVPFLKKIIGSRHKVTAIFTNMDKKKGRGRKLASNPVKKAAVSSGIKVFEIKEMGKDFIEYFSKVDFDYAVIISFGMILPRDILERWPGRWLNLHPSMLPRYRGPSPMISALLDGAQQTGVTINDVVYEVDTGDIFAQAKFNIEPDDNLGCLENKVIKFGGPLLITVLDIIENNDYKPFPQGEEGVTYTKKITKDDLLIDWTRSGKDIVNRIRAFSPVPGAYGFLCGERIKILKASKRESERASIQKFLQATTSNRIKGEDNDEGTEPAAGTIIASGIKQGLLVRCGREEIISLEELQPAGKKPMDHKSFINGYHPNAGARFENR